MLHQHKLHVKQASVHRAEGQHLLLEFAGCKADKLNNAGEIKRTLEEAVRLAGAKVVNSVFHQFRPSGVTGVLVLEESHISIHTWPSLGRASIDMFTCGECQPLNARDYLVQAFDAQEYEEMLVERGMKMRAASPSWGNEKTGNDK